MSEAVQEIIQQIQRLPKEDRTALETYLLTAAPPIAGYWLSA